MNKNQPKNLTTALWAGHIGLKMGRLALIMGLFVGLFMGQFSGVARADDLPAPLPVKTLEMALPDTAIRDQYGADVRLSDFKGTPLLVNFWATWCAPCIAELPALSRAAEALAEDGITILLVSIDRGGAEKALPFLQKYGVNGVALGFDPRAKLSRDMGVRGLPTTFLLNQKQTQSWQFVGPYEWDEAEMLTLIRELAGKAQGMNQK